MTVFVDCLVDKGCAVFKMAFICLLPYKLVLYYYDYKRFKDLMKIKKYKTVFDKHKREYEYICNSVWSLRLDDKFKIKYQQF